MSNTTQHRQLTDSMDRRIGGAIAGIASAGMVTALAVAVASAVGAIH